MFRPLSRFAEKGPAVWPALVAFLVADALVFLATAVLIFGVGLARSAGDRARVSSEAVKFAFSPPGIMAAALVSAGAFTAVALVAARLEKRDVRARLRLGPTRATVTGFVATVFGMAGLSAASGSVSDLLGGRGHGTMDVIAHALEHPSTGRLVLAVLTIAIAPGAAEEIFFRGLIQTHLASRWRRWPSIVATAFGFGLIHFDLVQGFVAFLAGIFLGWVVERFGGIRPSIVAHTCNNAAFVVAASTGSADQGSRATAVLVCAIGLAVCAAAITLLRSRFAIRELPSGWGVSGGSGAPPG